MWVGYHGAERNRWNRYRLEPDNPEGHHETYFLRANHPSKPLAFWIRYTIFFQHRHRQRARGEVWAIWFDGTQGHIKAARSQLPLAECRFHPDALDVQIGSAVLTDGHAAGSVHGETNIEWSLAFASTQRPALLLPYFFYELRWPPNKTLAVAPDARFKGSIVVDDEPYVIDRWRGTQNHAWGFRHIRRYGWGQVTGFDEMPDAFLECVSARVWFGTVYLPPVTVAILRLGEEEFRFNSIWQALRARHRLRSFDWTFASRGRSCRVRGRFHTLPSTIVALPYDNPTGGPRTCLHSEFATCELTIERAGHEPLHLTCRNRAAFEILTSRRRHGFPLAIPR